MGDASRYRIVVVDDEETMRSSLAAFLEGEGYHVAQAKDGREALDLIGRERPDAMVLDVMMPEMDGWSVLDKLDQEMKDRVVMLTSMEGQLDRYVSYSKGVPRHLPKPVNLDNLTRTLEEILGQR